MEEIPGLARLRANSEIVAEVNNDEELVITTFAHHDGVMLGQMKAFGWVVRGPNMFAWVKPTFTDEDINKEPTITY